MTKADAAPAPARRFYKAAASRADGESFVVLLDARVLKTPSGAPCRLPTHALAELCAAEWRAQGEHIVPTSMALTQLAFAAIDWTARDRAARVQFVTRYGETDLCCHRAEAPAALVARQGALWDPLVAWGEKALGVALPVVTGIVASPPPRAAIEMLQARADAMNDFHLTALAQATGLAGSVLIGFALLLGECDAKRAFEAAALDDLWSLERWGEDTEARARLTRVASEFDALDAFVRALDAR